MRVPLIAGGAGVPVIERDRCSGACVSSCPVDTVALRSRSASDAA
jgi:hypothetical protein